MEKKIFEFNVPSNRTVEIDGKTITIKPYLSLAEQAKLIEDYLSAYFHPENKSIEADERDYFNAENALKLAVIDLCTDITVGDNFETLLYVPELWCAIKAEIENYYDFQEVLLSIVENVEKKIDRDLSIGATLDSLFVKVNGLLSTLGENIKNFKPEDLEKLKTAGIELIDKLNATPLVQEVFKESGK